MTGITAWVEMEDPDQEPDDSYQDGDYESFWDDGLTPEEVYNGTY